MDAEEILTRFTYHPPREGQPERYDTIREHGRGLAKVINDLCPESRETSLAITHLEQAIMWANAAIARRETS